MAQLRRIVVVIVGLVLLAGVLAGAYWVAIRVWAVFAALPKEIAVGIVTGAATILASTLAVVAGRYFERKRELDALHRDKKIPIYNEFLKGVFETFYEDDQKRNEKKRSDKTIVLLREWQQKIILWGGSDVVNAYIRWKNSLTSGEQTAEAVFRTEELFFAIRRELGHNNFGIAKGSFIGFILRNPKIFLSMAARNPKVTLTEISEEEKKMET